MSHFPFGRFVFASLFSSLFVSLFSISALAQTSISCSEVTTPSHVEIQISNPYQDSWVRVDMREVLENGMQIRTLHDLAPHAEHASGLYQNHMFRLQIADLNKATTPAHIDFLYDVGVLRGSHDLVCHQ